MSQASGASAGDRATFISAAPPGGGWHTVCVKAAEALRAEHLGPAEIEVVTTPGGLRVFEETVRTRRGEGGTLIAFSPGLTMQILMKGSQYSYADITPIAALSTDYGALVVRPDSPIADLAGFLDALRRLPHGFAVTGGSGPGAMHHGMVGAIASAAGVASATVPYVGATGVADAIAGVKGGGIPVAALGAADVLADVRAGTLRILAVLAEDRLGEPFQRSPTAREQGLPVVFPMWRGFYGPPGMPGDGVTLWADVFTRLSRTQTWARVLDESAWFPFLLVGDAFAAFLRDDTRRYAEALHR